MGFGSIGCRLAEIAISAAHTNEIWNKYFSISKLSSFSENSYISKLFYFRGGR